MANGISKRRLGGWQYPCQICLIKPRDKGSVKEKKSLAVIDHVSFIQIRKLYRITLRQSTVSSSLPSSSNSSPLAADRNPYPSYVQLCPSVSNTILPLLAPPPTL